MKTKQFVFKGLAVIALSGLILVGCKKDKTINSPTETDNETSTSSDNALADATFDDVSNIADEAIETGSVSNYKMENGSGVLGCAKLKFDTLNRKDMKDTLTVIFGDSIGANCTCVDGRTRKGQIIITHDGRYRDSASTHTITFSNYYVNDNKVTGTKTVTNNGHNTADHLNWTVNIDGSIVLANGEGTIKWTSLRKRELLSGENSNGTINWKSAKWSITGTANGTGANGNTYSATIISPLIRDMSCGAPFKRHFTKGVLTLTPGAKPARTIDFGDGTCDDKATVKIKDNTYNFNLR